MRNLIDVYYNMYGKTFDNYMRLVRPILNLFIEIFMKLGTLVKIN